MVATPPRGEDPDSLIEKGGAEALSQILDDALDVFERKLQLIERKGLLASLAGRRRALDRLMSTLRAAKDPVTQDLYVSRAAQVLGVTEDSIRREMASGRDRVAPRTAASSSRADSGTPMLGGGRNLPEWTLIRVMLREVVGAELLQQVEGQARAAVGELLEEEWGALDMDALVEGALGKLESRRLETLLHERERRLPLAPEEEKPAIAREIDSLSRQIAQLNPGRWNVIRRGSSSAV
jgi:DNA primase